MQVKANTHSPLIVMVSNYPKGTGFAWWLMERFWNEISGAAEMHGWRSVVTYPHTSEEKNNGPTVPDLSQLEAFLSNGTLRDTITTYRLIRHYNIFSVYLIDRPYRSWKYLLFRLSGVKCVIVHDHTPGDRPAIMGIRGFIKQLFNSIPWITANQFIAISPMMRQRHLLNARIPASRIATVTNGIVVRDLVPNARKLLLEKFGLASDSYIVCVVGRLHPYKRFDFAIECINKLAQDNPASKPVLILIGDGPDRSRLEGIAKSIGSNCKVIFAGQVDDVWSLLCGVDTVIHPSAGEGLSLAILEAMAAARSVVVPSLPSVAQTIEHGISGLVYQEGSLDDAKKLLHDLSSDNTLRTKLGAQARKEVLEQYQLDRALKDFKEHVTPVLFNP